MHGVYGNFPNAEETQHVVDTVSIEIVRHILETAQPPLAAVGYHSVPIISREAPVLSVCRETIGRRTCLTVQIEVTWLWPYVATVAVYTDRNVAFQNHTLCRGVFVHSLQLTAQYELHVIIELHVLVSLVAAGGKHLPFRFVPLVVVGPLRKVGSAIFLAQHTVLCVRYQPTLVFSKESLEFLAADSSLSFLLVYKFQIFSL